MSATRQSYRLKKKRMADYLARRLWRNALIRAANAPNPINALVRAGILIQTPHHIDIQ